MRISRRKLWGAIQRYADAQQEDSWKGGGDPDSIPEIELELKTSAANLEYLVSLIVPPDGILAPERTR